MSEVRVVFVGAGPGSADLITLRGLQRLRQAEIVLADALTDPALRQEAPDAEWIDVGKRGFSTESTGQARINLLLVESARRSARVVRLKGGDPSMFGRLEEELHALGQAGIASEVVPGITSALAAAAATQQPLTRRGIGRSVAFSTAMTLASLPGWGLPCSCSVDSPLPSVGAWAPIGRLPPWVTWKTPWANFESLPRYSSNSCGLHR